MLMNIEYYKTCIADLHRQAGSGGNNAYYDLLKAELERLSDSWSKTEVSLTIEQITGLIDSKARLLKYLDEQKALRGGKS